MAANDPGLAPFQRPAEDALAPSSKHADVGKDEKSGISVSPASPVAPDQFDPEYMTGRRELWSYYAYYIGNNGLSLFNFGPTQFQNLLSQAAGESGMLFFAGQNRTIYSIVLLSNGISFAIQVVIFLILGSYADFGTWRPNILIVLSLLAYGIGFGWLGVHKPEDWRAGAALYILGLIAYQTTLTFWTAAFPGLARNTPELRASAEAYEQDQITRDQYDEEDSLIRSRIANMAFYIQSIGEIFILALIVGIMFGVHVDRSVEDNTWGLSILIAFATGVWLLVSIPWFLFEKRRPGLDPGNNIVLASLKQLWMAARQIWHLRQSLYYLIVTVIGTLQNSITSYNTLTLTYVLIVGIAAQAVGIYVFWWVQRRYRLSTKTMFNFVALGIVVLDGWGLIGIFTQKFGFHHEWEIWVYQAYYGLFVCPWYSYSQIMISEVTPRGHEFLFFALFSIIGKTSAFIGPQVSSAIIDTVPSHNESSPFYFLFALSLISAIFLVFFVDLRKSRLEQAQFLERENRVDAQGQLKLVDGHEARQDDS